MKIIFLDFDGVIITGRRFALRNTKSGSRSTAEPETVAVLNHIIAKTNAKIVISSSFRAYGLNFCKNWLRAQGVQGQVIDCTPAVLGPRGLEIAEWLDENAELDIEGFVILDDNHDMAHLIDHLVWTNYHVGLTDRDGEQAIAILNG